jgi:uncharacterized lipoprotein YmbA
MTRPTRCITIIALCLTALLAGCASTPPPTYYTLTALSASSGPNTATAAIIGVGPLEIPGYLDRLQIVTRPAPNRLRISDFERWAGPLDDNMLRVLADNLKTLTGAPGVRVFPWPVGQRPDLAVRLVVHAFEGVDGDRVTLRATATLSDLRHKSAPVIWDIHDEQTTVPGDCEALVAAQSRAMAVLSRSIAEKILSYKLDSLKFSVV